MPYDPCPWCAAFQASASAHLNDWIIVWYYTNYIFGLGSLLHGEGKVDTLGHMHPTWGGVERIEKMWSLKMNGVRPTLGYYNEEALGCFAHTAAALSFI